MSTAQENRELIALEERLTEYNLRGQWQSDANRPQSVGRSADGRVQIEPLPAGKPHLWQWQRMRPLLDEAAEALPESYTARRTLALRNSGLPRGTTHTMVASIQIIRAGELAWAHRHTINAVRFTIQGGPDVYTVVNGEPLFMEPYDLVITPGWSWHDHHNDSDKAAIWLDALDVPFSLALNQSFYEEFGEAAQQQTVPPMPASPLARLGESTGSLANRTMRYPWRESIQALKSAASRKDALVSPSDGVALEYLNPVTGSSVLPTLSCRIQWLPPGFVGRRTRRSSSAIHFVIEGQGRTAFDSEEFSWQQHDTLAVPNWIWHRHINHSRTDPAILFTLSDLPMLTPFGFFREERCD